MAMTDNLKECFRCVALSLEIVQELEDCYFCQCRNCNRKCCQKNDLAMCNAWPCPMGIALYAPVKKTQV